MTIADLIVTNNPKADAAIAQTMQKVYGSGIKYRFVYDGNIISEVKGMSKILDPVLLEEMIQYNESGNFDRIVAAELAIALAMKLNPIIGRVGAEQDGRIKAMFSKNKSTAAFAVLF